MHKVYKAISVQCRNQSYFEAGIPVWYPKLRPPKSQKCKNNSSKYRQITVSAQVPQYDLSVLRYSECKIAKIFRGFVPGSHWGGLTAPCIVNKQI